jgi:hypothetical protein
MASAGGVSDGQLPATVSQRRAADAESERIMALPAEKQEEISGEGAGVHAKGRSLGALSISWRCCTTDA